MALITRLDSAVTNGATLPLALPPVGVDDYVGRWLPSQLGGADGSAVTSLPAAYGTNRDLAAGGAPTLKVLGSDKYIQFDGIDDVLTQSVTAASWITTIVLARVDSSSPGGRIAAMAASAGPWITRGSTGIIKFAGGSNIDIGPSTPTVALGSWKVLSMVQNGASSLAGIDTTITSGTLGTRVSSALMLGKTDEGFGSVSIAEALVYSRALSATELQAVATALRANHAALVA